MLSNSNIYILKTVFVLPTEVKPTTASTNPVAKTEVVSESVDPYLDKEALRVLSLMPKWKPGKQRGVPVRVKFTIPINFKL